VPGSTLFVDNDLFSSLGETLLVFEHLFDTGYRGVSRVVGRVKQWGWQGGVVGSAGRRDRKPAILLTTTVTVPLTQSRLLFLQTNRRKWELAAINAEMSAETIAWADGVCRNGRVGSKCLQKRVRRRGGGRRVRLLLGFASAGTMNPVLGNVHCVAQRSPDLAGRIASGERIGGRQSELVQNHVAHESAAKVLTEFGRDRAREFGVLHSASVPALKVSERAETRRERRIRRQHLPRVRRAGDPAQTASRC